MSFYVALKLRILMPIVTMQGGGRFHNTLQDYMGVGELGCTGHHKLVLRNEWTAPLVNIG